MSSGDTGEGTSGTGAGAGNEADGGREIDSDTVIRLCEEKNGTDSKNVTSVECRHKILPV